MKVIHMRDEKIYGLDQHPDRERLETFTDEVPLGSHLVILEGKAWGKSSNLLCYFINVGNGKKYRLSVYSNNNYKPYNGSVAFDEASIGQSYAIRILKSKDDLPKFDFAEKAA